ncbi:hypothetical protein RJ639_047214 [Escallonia herrerae]|uniref:Uncharacterized protein n=1 Tax=Escallonia herrerae TaxID=1293975 RepID=A0AA88W5Q3_9ASTE|nr:hypothetical protein RJ639_047214 [Escallonia herrerae]
MRHLYLGNWYPIWSRTNKEIYEEKDWRCRGIHALTISRTEYVYTGSGRLHPILYNGQKIVVTVLGVCNRILCSESWDGTIRLWCLSDQSPLTVLGEDTPGIVTYILSIAADRHALVVAHENGCLEVNMGSPCAFDLNASSSRCNFFCQHGGKMAFYGGWDKTVVVQEEVVTQSDIRTTGEKKSPEQVRDSNFKSWKGTPVEKRCTNGLKIISESHKKLNQALAILMNGPVNHFLASKPHQSIINVKDTPRATGPGLKSSSTMISLANMGTAYPPTHPIVLIEIMALKITFSFKMGSPRITAIAAQSHTALIGTLCFG